MIYLNKLTFYKIRSDELHDDVFLFKMTSSLELKSQFEEDFFLFEHDAPVGMPDDVKVRFCDVKLRFL